jgi:hypothetical protein
MEKIIKCYALVMLILSSLMFVSCAKNDDGDRVRDYSFKANMEVIDDEGKVHEVDTPIKLRISLSDIKDRGDSIDITMSVGERKAVVYTEGKPSVKHQQNVTFKDAFIDNSVILNYVPKNGGKQVVKFVISNGKYSYTLEKELNVSTGTVITFTPLDPLKQVLNGRGSSGKIYIDNYKDEDNYYSVKYEVIEGKAACICQMITGNNHKPTDIIDMKNGETYRILDGKKAHSFVYNYYQNEEGHNTIRISIIDRYGNTESRTYQLFYAPKVDISIRADAKNMMGGDDITSCLFTISSSYKDISGKIKEYPVYCDKLVAEFDFTYGLINLAQGRKERKTKHIKLELQKGDCRNTYELIEAEPGSGGFSFLNLMMSTKVYEVKVKNFKISGMKDSDGRTYVLDKVLKYRETKSTIENPFNNSVVAERTFNIE